MTRDGERPSSVRLQQGLTAAVTPPGQGDRSDRATVISWATGEIGDPVTSISQVATIETSQGFAGQWPAPEGRRGPRGAGTLSRTAGAAEEAGVTETRWVVAVDGSSASLHALDWTLALADIHGASITVVRSWEPLRASPDHPRPDVELAAIGRELDELRRRVGGDDIETVAAHGDPVTVLLDRAETTALFVMGGRGLGGFQRMMVGSVSLQMATHSPVPVAIVAPTAAAEGRLDHIVVGVDGSPNSRRALEWALSFATGSTVVETVSAHPPRGRRARPGDDATLQRNELDDWMDGLVAEMGPVVRTFSEQRPADALRQQGAEADLVVVGARRRGPVAATVLGSVTNALLHRAPAPVVVVP